MAEDILQYGGAVRDTRCGSIAGSYHAQVSSYVLSPAILGRLTQNLDSQTSDLLTLQWPSPPRNILMVKKNRAPAINESVIEYAKCGLLYGMLL